MPAVVRFPSPGRSRLGWLAIITALLLSACGEPQERQSGTSGDAERIISLAPHLTELVFSAGAGDKLVGVVDYSDYPPAAQEIRRVGDAFRLDYESIIELDADLILGWKSGTPLEVIARLEQLGNRVVVLETDNLTEITQSLRAIGGYTGNSELADRVGKDFERELAKLRVTAADGEPVSVFYQVSAEPLFTISENHVISESIELCGGSNVFTGLSGPSPAVAVEAVIDAAPEAIIASRYTLRTITASGGNQLDVWRRWQSIPAVRNDNLYFVDADLMTRPSLRILDGIRELCEKIAQARAKRDR